MIFYHFHALDFVTLRLVTIDKKKVRISPCLGGPGIGLASQTLLFLSFLSLQGGSVMRRVPSTFCSDTNGAMAEKTSIPTGEKTIVVRTTVCSLFYNIYSLYLGIQDHVSIFY